MMKNIYSKVAAIILAGGRSRRAETIKGLRTIDNQFWIDRQIQFYKNIGIQHLIVGLGFDHEIYLNQSKLLKGCNHAINITPENGSFSTLQTALKHCIDSDWEQVIIIHVDHATPKIQTIQSMIEFEKYAVIKPTYSHKTGHPTILSHKFCQQLIQKPHQSQLNKEIKKLSINHVNWIAVDDKNILENLNTKDQWQKFKKSV